MSGQSNEELVSMRWDPSERREWFRYLGMRKEMDIVLMQWIFVNNNDTFPIRIKSISNI